MWTMRWRSDVSPPSALLEARTVSARRCEQVPSLAILAQSRRWNEATAMRAGLAVVFCVLLGWGPAWAACDGPPHDQFDFWLGAWHDPAAPAAEH